MGESDMNCEYCAAESGTYDLTQRCCRARFTAQTGHSRRRRHAWCDFWHKVLAADEAVATVEAAKQLWKDKHSSRLQQLMLKL